MKTVIHAKNETELKAASHFVSDATLILDSVRFNETAGTLDVAFEQTIFDESVPIGGGLVKRHEAPRYLFILNCKSVNRLMIEDTIQIGTYDFEWIEFDVEKSAIVLHTGAPLAFRIIVDSIDLTIRQAEEPLGLETYKTFLGLSSGDFFPRVYTMSETED